MLFMLAQEFRQERHLNSPVLGNYTQVRGLHRAVKYLRGNLLCYQGLMKTLGDRSCGF